MKRFVATIFLAASLSAFAGPEPAPNSTETYFLNAASALFAAKEASLAVYPSYDPYIKVGGVNKPWGFGLAWLYPVSNYAFVGGRVDFLGNVFWAPSAVVGAKYTLTQLPGQPTFFTVGGLIMPLSGAGDKNRSVGAITGLGATATIWRSKDGHLAVNAFIEAEQWTIFEGAIIHPGVAGSWKF